jgi:hypothetical protein
MKKNFLVYPVIAVIALLIGCGTGAPKVVSKAFHAKFPAATAVTWDQEDDNVWEAEFQLDNKEFTASFSEAGEWMETEYSIPLDELPDSVIKTIVYYYDGYIIDEAGWMETPDFVGYELEIEREGDPATELDVMITADGTIIAAEPDEQTGHDEDEE